MSDVQPTAPEVKPMELSTKDTENLVADCNQKLSACVSARLPFEKDWYYNMAFYFGRQWVQWVGTNTQSFDLLRLYEPPVPKHRVRLVINKTRRYTRKELAKLTKERVTYYVAPESSEDLDIAAAEAAQQIADFLFGEVNWEFKKRSAVFWALMCGSGFLKDYFDPTQMDFSQQLGKICLEVVSPFHLFAPDMQEMDIEGQAFLIHAMAKDSSWVEERIGQTVAPDSVVTGGTLEQKFLSSLGLSSSNSSKKVHVREIWMKPCRKYPEGAVIMWTNDQLLSYTPYWPFNYSEFPFAKIDHIMTGRFYADSIIKDLIPLQKEYNRSRSQLIEAKNRMAKPQLIAQMGSIDPQKITSEPGLIIEYKPGFPPPQALNLSEIPQYAVMEPDRIQKDMDDITAQGEITQGRTPPGVEAASAIAYLQEENDTILSAAATSIEEAVQKIGRHLLIHADYFWDDPRKVKVIGTNKIFEAQAFSAADIRGNTDLRVETGSAQPKSRAARQAFLTELTKMQVLSPDKLLKYLDMGETNRAFEELQVSSRQATRENIRMGQSGQALPINPFDDDMIHDMEHSNYMRGQQYEMLPDENKNALLEHLMMHRQRVQMAYAAQQQPGTPQEQPQGDNNVSGNP